MRIICISRGSHAYGLELAEKLAAKLGFACIGREALTDEAAAQGIPIGRIETAIVKRRPLSEEMEIAVDRFKALVSVMLCSKAKTCDGIVYHGRTGHLVLPGVSHVLRVRAIAAMEERIQAAMARMNLSREKAKLYVEQVEEDRRRWVRALYNLDWDDPGLYDIVINTQHLSIDNASVVLMQMAQLPEFAPTPVSCQALEDLLLASRCRLAIGADPRTSGIKVTVKVEKGHVSVTYLPRQATAAGAIPAVLEKVDGIRSMVCTMATTNLLFLQERFDPPSSSLQDLIDLAEKWNAAVELVRLEHGARPAAKGEEAAGSAQGCREYDGGILDDEPPGPTQETERAGLTETVDRLIQAGRAGGSRTIYGGSEALIQEIQRMRNYSLVVVGDVFLAHSETVRGRLKRDLIALLSEKVRVPVIESSLLRARYLFGPRQLAGMVGCGIAALVLYLLIFRYQSQVLTFLTPAGLIGKLAAAAAVAVLVPLVAYNLGSFYRNLLKLIRIE